MTSNNAPACKWYRIELACGTIRQRLYLDGKETPWFVDSAAVMAHRCQGDKHGLWGAGLSVPNRYGRRHAECFASGSKIEPLKAKAEQMALSMLEAA